MSLSKERRASKLFMRYEYHIVGVKEERKSILLLACGEGRGNGVGNTSQCGLEESFVFLGRNPECVRELRAYNYNSVTSYASGQWANNLVRMQLCAYFQHFLIRSMQLPRNLVDSRFI